MDVSRLFCARIFLILEFSRSRPCSHVDALLRKLLEWNDPGVETLLVTVADSFFGSNSSVADSKIAHAKA